MKTKNGETKKKGRLKRWWNNNWEKILLSMSAGAAVVMTMVITKMYVDESRKAKLLKKEGEKILETFSKPSVKTTMAPLAAKIDEDIFVNLAPAIEDAVLQSLVDKAHLEQSYDLDGLTHKLVTVDVETIFGD